MGDVNGCTIYNPENSLSTMIYDENNNIFLNTINDYTSDVNFCVPTTLYTNDSIFDEIMQDLQYYNAFGTYELIHIQGYPDNIVGHVAHDSNPDDGIVSGNDGDNTIPFVYTSDLYGKNRLAFFNSDGNPTILHTFNGLSNTKAIMDNIDVYSSQIKFAVIEAHNYQSETHNYNPNVEWYLPDIGELVYLTTRLYEIQRSLYLLSNHYDDVTCININNDVYYWTSTQTNDSTFMKLNTLYNRMVRNEN
jgi:hypothetical protein